MQLKFTSLCYLPDDLANREMYLDTYIPGIDKQVVCSTGCDFRRKERKLSFIHDNHANTSPLLRARAHTHTQRKESEWEAEIEREKEAGEGSH